MDDLQQEGRDPQRETAARRAEVLLICYFVLSIPLLWWLIQDIRSLDVSSAASCEKVQQRLFAVFGILIFSIELSAWWLYQLGQRIHSEGRFPPTGTLLTKTGQPTLTGPPASRCGTVAIVAGTLIALAGAGLAGLCWRIFAALRCP